jgi:hypothetical protein
LLKLKLKNTAEEVQGDQTNNPSSAPAPGLVLRQQLYLYLIDDLASRTEDWNAVLNLVLEAFENVPVELQKPLWRWRVTVLSKKGKSVLDGINKLTAGQRDPELQAR